MWSSSLTRCVAIALSLLAAGLVLAAGCSHTQPAKTPIPVAAVYVGNAACAGCHPAEFESHRRSRHALTLRRLETGHTALFSPPTGDIPQTPYSVVKQGAAYRFATNDPPSEAQPIQFAFGSGKTGITYVKVMGADSLMEMRMSYFPHLGKWCVTPGQEALQDHDVGFLHRGQEAHKCVLCHAVTLAPGTLTPDPRFFGVGCESCHGPGGAHIAAVQAGQRSDLKIEKIGSWGATRINEMCARCHRSLQDVDVNGISVTMTQRFQPYGLMQSQCFQQSHDTLSCLTCHNPHTDASTDLHTYETACLQCHHGPQAPASPGAAPATTVLGKTCPVNPRSGCIGCHMRSRKVFVSSEVSTSMADHLITAERNLP